jgi:polyhydroxyalkanoate synthesis regulator phasin
MFLAGITAYALAQAAPPAPAGNGLPDGPGKPVVERSCASCHALKVIVSKKATKDEWAKTVNDMVNRGAQLSDDEIDMVIDYLSANFKPDEAKIEQATAQTMTDHLHSLDRLADIGPVAAQRRSLSLARYMAPFPGGGLESRLPRTY